MKYLFFTACLLVLIVSDVYNISNEYQLPDQSAKYWYIYTRDLVLGKLLETSTFYTVLLVFTVS